MVPHISSAEEAAAVVAAAHYPPRGHRGFSRSARVYGYGLRPPGRSEEIVPPLIYAQIETLAGVERAEEIARVAGVDVLFVGPADLQFDLSVRAADHPPAYEECLQRVAQAAAAADKAAGVLIRQTAEIESFRKLGFSHLAIDSDLALLRKGWEAIVKTTAQP
jgi:2-dehydro-3-deoxyglucarate aldolase/4-hydroxy-2-oxoheptanedioate aldolase